MLETLVLHGDLMKEGALSSDDEVVEIEPCIKVFEARHREHGSGFLIELKSTDDFLYGFFRVEDHMWPVVQEIEANTDFPFLAIKSGTQVHTIRRGYGMHPEPLFELCSEQDIRDERHIKTYGL